MGDIIKLSTPNEEQKERIPIIWSCAECGCVSWFVHEDFLKCTHCHNISTGCGAAWKIEPPNLQPTEVASRTYSEAGVNNSEFLLKGHIKHLSEADISIIIKPNGNIATYNGITAKEISAKWLKSRLKAAVEMLEPKKP